VYKLSLLYCVGGG